MTRVENENEMSTVVGYYIYGIVCFNYLFSQKFYFSFEFHCIFHQKKYLFFTQIFKYNVIKRLLKLLVLKHYSASEYAKFFIQNSL